MRPQFWNDPGLSAGFLSNSFKFSFKLACLDCLLPNSKQALFCNIYEIFTRDGDFGIHFSCPLNVGSFHDNSSCSVTSLPLLLPSC